VTTTAEIESSLLSALSTIRQNWAALLLPSGSGGVASKPQPKALYTLDDDDERDHDLPPIDRRIALRHDVTMALNGWARVIVDDRELIHHLPSGTDTLGLCVLIERHARWLSGHEAGEDAAEELRGWAGKVRAAAVPQRREWMPLGTCPLEVDVLGAILAHDDGSPLICGGQVRAYPGHDPRCHKCGTEADATWWERVMFPDAETSTLVTADELVLVLHRAFGGSPVKPTTIRQWIARGVIKPSGKDDKGRTLFNRSYVVRTLAERQESVG
jgi:hypothetical protein